MIPRAHFSAIKDKILNSNKVVILLGPRQVGKTTLIKQILEEIPLKKLEINADERQYLDVLSSRDLSKMKLLVEGYDLLFVDEAQRIPEVGINLKILHDSLPELKIIATGSSSFDLSNQIKEPLTGRTWTYVLYPISYFELKKQFNSFELVRQLDTHLVFGLYPEQLSFPNREDKIQYLREISSAYLYKDILEITSIKHSHKLHDLLRLLAFQIGSQVSMTELGNTLGMSKDTVESYIDLLEKSFVVFRLSGFSRNLRKEVSKMDKIYFYDLGIRNTIIENFNPLAFREDKGKLWENFLMLERKKQLAYTGASVNAYFWRTYTGAELDYVEEASGLLKGFEFKYSSKKGRPPKTWQETYPQSSYACINRENFLEFVLGEG